MVFVGPSPVQGGAASEDNRRARELYRYLDPSDLVSQNPESHDVPERLPIATTPSLSSALRPFVQFAALRCNTQRAFISVTNDTQQFFLSEASRVFEVSNVEEQWEDDENLLWLGCGGVNKEGKLCETTLALPASPPGDYPFFIVPDLAVNKTYGKLPFVTGPPSFRFYAGTPLTTKNGIRIGSLCVMDTKIREDLSADQRKFLGQMAEQIMGYLEINRDALEGRRSRIMSDALNRFILGKSSLPSSHPGSTRHSVSDSRELKALGDSASVSESVRIARESSPIVGTTSSAEVTDSQTRSSRVAEEADESRNHPGTLVRAANLLREALEIDGDGGVAFLEATSRTPPSFKAHEPHVTETDTSGTDEGSLPKGLSHSMNASAGDPRQGIFHKSQTNLEGSSTRPPVCRVQASSTSAVPMGLLAEQVNGAKVSQVDPEFLRELLQRYPRGQLWVFDADGGLMSSDDDRLSSRKAVGAPVKFPRKGRRKRAEAERLQRLFPGSRQLIFAPLWDASIGKWYAGCFCWAASDHRTYTVDRELGFTMSFTKSVMAECNRLDTLVSDKLKGDFIGSISHELRSPLHGILASAEFLLDTEMSVFQRSLADTIEACGRTLLDTINHVLDYSKISSFEKSFRESTKSKASSSLDSSIIPAPGRQLPNAAPPLLRLFSQTDIAAIAEEVIEGLVVGRQYVQAPDLTDVSAAKVRRESKTRRIGSISNDLGQGNNEKDEVVDVYLQIDPEDWRFVSQPGALRRVIMNLVGNSLKYTSRGSVRVRLQQQHVQSDDSEHERKNITLTIADTGKGISSEYLQSKLFTPFAQEDSLTPGTGLGLSIVRSIVTMLGGTIDVRSAVGQGTTITVNLPVARPYTSSTSDGSNPPSDSTVTSSEEHIAPLKILGKGRNISIYASPLQRDISVRQQEWNRIASNYINQWFGLQVQPWSESEISELVIVEEQHLVELTSNLSSKDSDRHHGILVLCRDATQYRKTASEAALLSSHHVIEWMTMSPLGPYKLARSLRSCIEQIDNFGMAVSGVSTESPISPLSEQLISTDLSEKMQEMELDSTDEGGRPMVVQANETISVKETSRNAQMALNSPFHEGPSNSPSPSSEFPFPSSSPSPARSKPPISRQTSAAKSVANVLDLPTTSTKPESTGTTEAATSIAVEVPTSSDQPRNFDPHVLLVDDNAINLRLLQTFMRKRKYNSISSAENGVQAVEAVKSSSRNFDVIFMDISMPLLDGFSATRLIREWETANQVKTPAMVIALTGLASGRDQNEAFSSGVDIYMTKPVSFKEVSRLLDNFEINMRGTA